MKYAVLIKPNNNIAFTEQYHIMCQSELKIMAKAYDLELSQLEIHSFNKATYLSFDVAKVLSLMPLGLYIIYPSFIWFLL